MAGEGREAVILLDKSRIVVYTGNDFLGVDVPETVVRDIDVVDKSGFDSLVDTFIKTKRLNSAPVWLVLADGICFSKDVTETDARKVLDADFARYILGSRDLMIMGNMLTKVFLPANTHETPQEAPNKKSKLL